MCATALWLADLTCSLAAYEASSMITPSHHSFTMAASLLDLPDELVIAILAQVDDLIALRYAARCSRKVQALAEPFLYRDIFFRSGTEAVRLANSLHSRHQRCRAIRTLDVRCKRRVAMENLPIIAVILRLATQLREFTLESPYCNNSRWLHAKGWDERMEAILCPLVLAAGMLDSDERKPLQSLTRRRPIRLLVYTNTGASERLTSFGQ